MEEEGHVQCTEAREFENGERAGEIASAAQKAERPPCEAMAEAMCQQLQTELTQALGQLGQLEISISSHGFDKTAGPPTESVVSLRTIHAEIDVAQRRKHAAGLAAARHKEDAVAVRRSLRSLEARLVGLQ